MGTRNALNIWLLSLKDEINVKYSGNAAAMNHTDAADQYSIFPGVTFFFIIPILSQSLWRNTRLTTNENARQIRTTTTAIESAYPRRLYVKALL